MEETPTITRIYETEMNRMVKATIKQQWSKWPGKAFSLKKDEHHGSYSDLYWIDHVTTRQMKQVLDHFSYKKGAYVSYSEPSNVFTFDGKQYSNRCYINYYRLYSLDFLKRIAVIFCRHHQVPLPEIYVTKHSWEYGAHIREEKDEPQIEGRALSKAIMLYAATIDVADIERLEQETEAQYPPLPVVDQAIQGQRDEAHEQRLRTQRINEDYTRQNYQYQLAVFTQIPGRESLVAELQSQASDLAKRMRKLSPDLYEPVICHGCKSFIEEEQCLQKTHPSLCITRYLCEQCQQAGKVFFLPDHQDLLDEVKQLDLEEQEVCEEPYVPTLDEQTGLYRAKNSESMPILTRDLLHDVRVSKWWLWFGPEQDTKKVPSQEIRDALYKAGWRWGYGRRQYHMSNKFGVLKIPEIVYEQYGGYIDGGFCDYRSTRGARLRTYADKIEGKAEDMAEWSEEIAAKYMATGSIITGGRRTRKLQKEKARAEKKAAEARRLDVYAHDLRGRANDSEDYQQRLTSDKMLPRRLETLYTDLRRYDRDFDKSVDYTTYNLFYNGDGKRSVRWYINDYLTSIEPRKDIIQEEIDLIEATIKAREAGQQQEREKPIPVDVPDVPERSFSVEGVIEVNVGRDNYSDLFPTLPGIADLILDLFPMSAAARFVLEPNGGTGSYLARIVHHLSSIGSSAQVHTYEWLYDLYTHLQEKAYQVLGNDFLKATLPPEVQAQGGYDEVAMNPPFKDWEKHLVQAWKLTRPGGRIRCIIPRGLDRNARYIRLMLDMDARSGLVDLPDNAFKQSNTNVQTSVLYLHKAEKVEKVVSAPEEKHQPVAEEEVPTLALPKRDVIQIDKLLPIFGKSSVPVSIKRKKQQEPAATVMQPSLF